MKKKHKPVIYCGVTDHEWKPVKMTKKEREEFVKMCGDGGKYNAVFLEYPLKIKI